MEEKLSSTTMYLIHVKRSYFARNLLRQRSSFCQIIQTMNSAQYLFISFESNMSVDLPIYAASVFINVERDIDCH